MHRLWRDRVFVISAVVTAAALLVGLVWSFSAGQASEHDRGQVVDLRDVDQLKDVVGERVSAEAARVQSVPADEGFWASADGGDRVWVQIDTAGESPFVVEPGMRVSFTGQVVAHGADFVVSPDFPAADAEDLVDAGAHVEADVDDIRLG